MPGRCVGSSECEPPPARAGRKSALGPNHPAKCVLSNGRACHVNAFDLRVMDCSLTVPQLHPDQEQISALAEESSSDQSKQKRVRAFDHLKTLLIAHPRADEQAVYIPRVKRRGSHRRVEGACTRPARNGRPSHQRRRARNLRGIGRAFHGRAARRHGRRFHLTGADASPSRRRPEQDSGVALPVPRRSSCYLGGAERSQDGTRAMPGKATRDNPTGSSFERGGVLHYRRDARGSARLTRERNEAQRRPRCAACARLSVAAAARPDVLLSFVSSSGAKTIGIQRCRYSQRPVAQISFKFANKIWAPIAMHGNENAQCAVDRPTGCRCQRAVANGASAFGCGECGPQCVCRRPPHDGTIYA